MHPTLRRLRRHPLAHWIVVAALALVSALAIARATGRADAARRAWGETRPVAVATRYIEAGAVVGADDVDVEPWPLALAPAGVLDRAPVGRTTRTPLEPGEPIARSRVAPDGVSGLAALVPSGWRAVAIALGPASVPLEPGDQIDLLATAADGSVTGTIAEAALVLRADERSITVALPKDVVARVAGALVSGAIVPALRPASEDPMPR